MGECVMNKVWVSLLILTAGDASAASAFAAAMTAPGSGAGAPAAAPLTSFSTGPGVSDTPIAAPGGPGSFSLPATLMPRQGRRDNKYMITAYIEGVGQVQTTQRDVDVDRSPLLAVAGTPREMVAACREALLSAAGRYNPVYATTASGGVPRRVTNGFVAPIQTKLVYFRQGGFEVRRTRVNCRVRADGRVAAIS
jgi:hypothetical protein